MKITVTGFRIIVAATAVGIETITTREIILLTMMVGTERTTVQTDITVGDALETIITKIIMKTATIEATETEFTITKVNTTTNTINTTITDTVDLVQILTATKGVIIEVVTTETAKTVIMDMTMVDLDIRVTGAVPVPEGIMIPTTANTTMEMIIVMDHTGVVVQVEGLKVAGTTEEPVIRIEPMVT